MKSHQKKAVGLVVSTGTALVTLGIYVATITWVRPGRRSMPGLNGVGGGSIAFAGHADMIDRRKLFSLLRDHGLHVDPSGRGDHYRIVDARSGRLVSGTVPHHKTISSRTYGIVRRGAKECCDIVLPSWSRAKAWR